MGVKFFLKMFFLVLFNNNNMDKLYFHPQDLVK